MIKMTRKFLFLPFDMLTNFLILQHQQVWLTLTHHCANKLLLRTIESSGIKTETHHARTRCPGSQVETRTLRPPHHLSME